MAVLMKLGPISFEVMKTAYDRISEKTTYRWTELKRIGNRSRMQYLGQDNDSLSFSGTIYPLLAGKSGLEHYKMLKDEAAKGSPLVMVDALGKVHGKWVITDLSKEESAINRDSIAQKIEFNVSLRAYS